MLKKLRAEKNWSQEQLATFSGLSTRTIQQVESGQSASIETLKSIASVFEVDISKLTEEIKVIDKNQSIGKHSIGSLECQLGGTASRKAQIRIELVLLGLAIFETIMIYFHPWACSYSPDTDVRPL
ncbi:helix-turn-helix domain-containing protein [Vibrio nigripulchritudo]|uniref:helix-turn-helix domain-containing protein n=1 Tax=Vibrio nigripulchritudo TaxID=28173 RepID=UPI0009B67B03